MLNIPQTDRQIWTRGQLGSSLSAQVNEPTADLTSIVGLGVVCAGWLDATAGPCRRLAAARAGALQLLPPGPPSVVISNFSE